MPTARTTRRSISWLITCSLAALAVAIPTPATGQAGPIDGTYRLTFTVPRFCHAEDGVVYEQGSSQSTNARIVQDGSQVAFTIYGQTFTGSLDASLNFDLDIPGSPMTGHFTLLSDGGATVSGDWKTNCKDGTFRTFFKVTGKRTSGGPPSPSPTPTQTDKARLEGMIGASAAEEAYRNFCGDEANRNPCRDASDESQDWASAMNEDIRALRPPPSPQLAQALSQLGAIVSRAALLGALQVSTQLANGMCGRPQLVYPVVTTMLPNFAKLFIQGINSVGNGQLEGVERARDLADALLAIAIDASLNPRTGGISCPA